MHVFLCDFYIHKLNITYHTISIPISKGYVCMKLYRRRFKTTSELLEFYEKLIAYGHPFFPITSYTEDGFEYIEYGKIDGKDEVTIHFTPWG